jgi:hypothetical protein
MGSEWKNLHLNRKRLMMWFCRLMVNGQRKEMTKEVGGKVEIFEIRLG